jgi:hypothetical protein
MVVRVRFVPVPTPAGVTVTVPALAEGAIVPKSIGAVLVSAIGPMIVAEAVDDAVDWFWLKELEVNPRTAIAITNNLVMFFILI